MKLQRNASGMWWMPRIVFWEDWPQTLPIFCAYRPTIGHSANKKGCHTGVDRIRAMASSTRASGIQLAQMDAQRNGHSPAPAVPVAPRTPPILPPKALKKHAHPDRRDSAGTIRPINAARKSCAAVQTGRRKRARVTDFAAQMMEPGMPDPGCRVFFIKYRDNN